MFAVLALVASMSAAAKEEGAYWNAKAQCWRDLAIAEAGQGDVRGTSASATANADAIASALGKGLQPVETSIFTKKILPSLDPSYGRPKWAEVILTAEATLQKYDVLQCRSAVSACLEVGLQSVYENMEETEGGRWNHGGPEVEKAAALAERALAELPIACQEQQLIAAPVSASPEPVVQQEVLLTDVLFAFDSSTLSEPGVRAVESLVLRLSKTSPSRSWTVIGHADRLGSPQRNQVLSRERANAVAAVISARAPGVRLLTFGSGSTSPVVDCPGTPTSETIACLAPNRRVVVRAVE